MADGFSPDTARGGARAGFRSRPHIGRIPQGQHFFFSGTHAAGFNAKNAELVAKGFAMQYDNAYQECDGLVRRQAFSVSRG